jgi:superfamily II DNA or RNA helicase
MRCWARKRLTKQATSGERVIVATGRYIGEGFDDARLDTLFLTMPVSWKGTLIQYTGRIHRLHPAKREVRIYDYVDSQVPVRVRRVGARAPEQRDPHRRSRPATVLGVVVRLTKGDRCLDQHYGLGGDDRNHGVRCERFRCPACRPARCFSRIVH